MKCYVIKNEEGKYFELVCDRFIDYLTTYEMNHATIVNDKKFAQKIIEKKKLKNCKIIECTLAEGDLESQIKDLREYLSATQDLYEEEQKRANRLEKELEVYKKALEMALDQLGGYVKENGEIVNNLESIDNEPLKSYLLKQARKELEK